MKEYHGFNSEQEYEEYTQLILKEYHQSLENE